MKVRAYFYTLILTALFVTQANASVLETVNKEVWQIFKSSLEKGDAEAFNAIHTDDVIRSYGDVIITGNAFREKNVKVLSNPKLPEMTIDFSFISRAHTDDVVYEVGYYKQKMVRDGKERTSYGMFHVVLKKLDGKWKVAQDWDTSTINGEKVGESHFASGELLKLI